MTLFCYFSIFSDYTWFHLEVENLTDLLKKNSYQSGIIEQSIRSLLNKLHVPKKVMPTVPRKERFIVLSYLGTLSSNLKQKLRTGFKNSLPKSNIKKILKLRNSIFSLFRFKDVIPKELRKIQWAQWYIIFNRKKVRMQTICSFRSAFTAKTWQRV